VIAPTVRKASPRLNPTATAIIHKAQSGKLSIVYVPHCTGTTQFEFGMVNKSLMGTIGMLRRADLVRGQWFQFGDEGSRPSLGLCEDVRPNAGVSGLPYVGEKPND
jgi:hypothetical protein